MDIDVGGIWMILSFVVKSMAVLFTSQTTGSGAGLPLATQVRVTVSPGDTIVSLSGTSVNTKGAERDGNEERKEEQKRVKNGIL